MPDALRPDQVRELRQIFDLFDSDGDGLLEVEEIGAIWAACGTVLTEAEVLDLATELKPDLRKLPFDEFVNMMCRPMVDRPALEAEISETFGTFAGGAKAITPPSLGQALLELGQPTEGLVSEEMVSEAGPQPGKVGHPDFCAMAGLKPGVK